MLILTRKERENTYLILPDGTEIKVTLCSIINSREAKLGFECPTAIKILREEVKKKDDLLLSKK